MEAMVIKGLKTDLRETVRVMKSEGLAHAMELAISIEDNQRVGVDTRVGGNYNRSNSYCYNSAAGLDFNRNSVSSSSQAVTPKGSVSVSSSITKGGEEEEASRDEDDHVHLDMVEVSLNSVLGFTPPRTMKLRRNINGADVLVLFDFGATHNFIAQQLVYQLGLEVTG
nr:hypothetical protein [Tanacetum cinerariifolium]